MTSCVVLLGGIIGCGKSTFLKYIQNNDSFLFKRSPLVLDESKSESAQEGDRTLFKIVLDELCPIQEQAKLMTTLKGWRCFRIDLLMAAEHMISSLCDSKLVMFGPLTERSSLLLNNMKKLNESSRRLKNVVFFIEDNFYYRSMRYDWFQLAKRANIGFCQIFLQCPLYTAIYRNSNRGYRIPEEKIKQMLTFIEYPNPEKYKWETYSVILCSNDTSEEKPLKDVIDVIKQASKNPAEVMIMQDKVEAQIIGSKNILHQADNILRKLVSKKILFYQDSIHGTDFKSLISELNEIRHELLCSIKQDSVHLPPSLLENLKNQGIKSVQEEFEKVLSDYFEDLWKKKLFDVESRLKLSVEL